MTRADYFNDPTTAPRQLHDDILGLVGVLPKLKNGNATA
jgi:hypothetical protein